MNRYRLVRWALAGSVVLVACSWWCKDSLPPPGRLRGELLTEPVQVAVDTPPRDTIVEGVRYRIEPRYSYDISGLVVSLHHSDTWWDYAHREWNDHINLMDLCVVWGPNASSGIYRSISFSNTQWECHFATHSSQVWSQFHQDAVSNNHLLTDRPDVARQMLRIHLGDQVRIRGYLVNYTIFADGVPRGTRVSSTTRTDSGPGACEVVYVESVEILDSPGRAWRVLYRLGLAALLAAFAAWALLPARSFDAQA
jgi:hypothetical protein